MGLGDWRSEASHAAASTKRTAKMPTETRFKFNERISGERPTDSIPLVKLRAAAIPMPGQPSGLAVERCMFGAVQLRTDAFILSFVCYRSAKHGADPGRDAGARTDADSAGGRRRAGQRCRPPVEQRFRQSVRDGRAKRGYHRNLKEER